MRFNASRGVYGPGSSDDFVAERIARLLNDDEPTRLRLHPSQRVLEVRSARLPDGGIVTTYTDVTQSVAAEESLEAANEQLERRVQERTAELERLNHELARAKTAAEDANLSKTRFLAAAGHDILQPLNAARLYASSLTESAADAGPEERIALARNVDASLEAVEEIFGALLDISRLDAGATRPEISDFPIQDIFRQLEIEFAPMARAKGLELSFVPTALDIRSDRRLMRRLLQNFVSNAVKYTLRGRVLVGCRRARAPCGSRCGIPGSACRQVEQRRIFDEFMRLDAGARAARGLGLGLSIVERLGRVLAHPISLRSRLGRGLRVRGRGAARRAGSGARGRAERRRAVLNNEPLQGLKVLAIDNEPRVLDGMRVLLQKWGCRVATADGLAGALASLAVRPDVIIADYHLDEGDGLAAIAALRERLGYSRRRFSPPPTAAQRCGARRPRPRSRCSTSR